MKFIRFQASGLNGYLNFDLKFDPTLSFLIGINGSGKTSVLRATMALLGPDLDWLMNAAYHRISLHIDDRGQPSVITAAKSGDSVRIHFDRINQKLEATISRGQYQSMVRKTEDYAYDEDGEVIRIRETRADVPDSIEVLAAIKALPNPIFLGLDRSSLPTARAQPRSPRPRPPRRTHATLRAFLDESVSQAEVLATDANRTALVQRSRLAAELRENILLTLFSEVDPQTDQTDLPKRADLRRFESTRKSIKTAFSILGIAESRIAESIDPFFSKVIICCSSNAA